MLTLPNLYRYKSMDEKTRRQHRREAVQRYNSKAYSPLTIRVRKDGSDGFLVDDLRQAAQRDGMSLNAWLVALIRDNL